MALCVRVQGPKGKQGFRSLFGVFFSGRHEGGAQGRGPRGNGMMKWGHKKGGSLVQEHREEQEPI